MENIQVFRDAIKEQKIVKGIVKMIEFNNILEQEVAYVDIQGTQGLILLEEADNRDTLKTLYPLVGREVYVTIKEIDVDNDTLICSRKEAQNLMYDGIVEGLKEGKAIDAEITNFTEFGAFVEFKGISGLLRNADFSQDHTSVSDVCHLGETVKVTLKNESENKNLLFEAVEKYCEPTIMSFDKFKPGQVILGEVSSVKTWGAFVNIAPGLDALCSIPTFGEVDMGSRVTMRITKVFPEEQRVRGKILRILPN